MPLDLTVSPLYRINGQEMPALPGLIALMPPSTNVARIREPDRLIAYLLLTGTAVYTTSEYMQVAVDASKVFYATPGSVTNALRVTTESVNKALLDRNMNSSSRGQYSVGWLTLGVLRDTQFTFSLSGPMHLYHFGKDEVRHFFEPQVSGKGLGVNQVANLHFAQVPLQAGDRLLACGRMPVVWENSLNDPRPSSLDSMRRKLLTITSDDLNAVLVQATDGSGLVKLLSGASEPKQEKVSEPISTPTTPPPSVISRLPHHEETVSTPEPLPAVPTAEESFPSTTGMEELPISEPSTSTPSTVDESAAMHVVQPSAYAIPPQHEETASPPQSTNPLDRLPRKPQSVPTSIPRAGTSSTQPVPPVVKTEPVAELPEEPAPAESAAVEEEKPVAATAAAVEKKPEAPREPSETARRAAKIAAGGIQATRRISGSIGERLGKFLPRLLPNSAPTDVISPSNNLMLIIAIIVPLIVVTMASVVYLRYGRSLQYEAYLSQARKLRDTAVTLTNPVEQRKTWENVLLNVDIAESHRTTNETIELRQEAETNLDKLLGITRLQFNPVFSSSLGIDISRMAASETDLFMLNAATGEVLRAQLTSGRGFQLDTAFNCRPGVYGSYTVGPLVDISAMPTLNSINATLLGVDAAGNLLYCAPGQVAQAIPLPVPDTNWGRVTAFTLDSGNLYVLDAPARALWVYTGKDGTFIDRPYFFFGGQTPEKQDVIDFAVTGDDLYMLHSDSHISTCSYSRIESVPTRCQDPTPLINPFSAYQDVDLFGTAHFTQVLFGAPPDPSILILDADTQGVMRFAQRTLELQNQFRPTTGSSNPIPSGPVGAVTVSPNHIIYLAVNGQVYFATMP